ADQIENFSIIELIYRLPTPAAAGTKAALVVDRQEFTGFADDEGVWHFLFSPKEAKRWEYAIRSDDGRLDGQTGGFTSYWPAPTQAAQPSKRFPNWWTDDPDPAASEGVWQGAKSISHCREDFLRDFAERMNRCRAPAARPAQ